MSADGRGLGLPLAGVKVLDFTQIVAGPFCTRLLADLGADVAKVESMARQERVGASKLGPDYKGRMDRSPTFANTNRNKRSITLNLKTPGGLELARRLADVADVIVENFSATVMDRLGLGYKDLQPSNPRLIYVSMSGYGHNGPRRDWTSMNSNLQAYSGLMMVTGAEGDEPISVSNSWNDYMGGLHACFGVLTALTERRSTGLGANLDMAQFEGSVATLGGPLLASSVNDKPPPRLGSRATNAVPQGCYRCAGDDEWCVISVQSDEQWRDLARALSDVPQLREERFATLLERLHRHDEIDSLIESWTSQLANTEVERRLKAIGVPAERMRRIKDVLESPDSGKVFRPIEDPPGWRILVTGLPFTFGRSSVADPQPTARLGEHTQEILHEWLGLNENDLEPFAAQEALS